MVDLERQLADYGEFHDEEQGSISPFDIIDETRGAMAVATSTRQLGAMSKFWMGVAAAALVILLVGLIPLWLGNTDPSDVVEEPDLITPTTAVDSAPEVTEATEITEPPEPAVVEQTDLDSTVTSLGTLTWTRVSGDENTIPECCIEIDPEAGYKASGDGFTYRSDDGLTWVREEIGTEPGENFHARDGWALSYPAAPGRVPTLFEEVGGTWDEVALPKAPLPPIEGLNWQVNPLHPVESGDRTLVVAMAHARIPWEDYYGTFQFECGLPEPCDEPAHAWWDNFAQAFRIDNLETGQAIAGLLLTVDDNRLVFGDQNTGETVHVIVARDSAEAESFADQLKSQGSVTQSGVWVREGAGAFAYHDAPWVSSWQPVIALQDGGFAVYELAWDWNDPISPLQGSAVWTSTNGIDWANHGPLGFLPEGRIEHVDISDRTGILTAIVITGYNQATGQEHYESWESEDGLGWTQVETIFPTWTETHETNFGFVATAMPQSRHLFWVSADGENWEELAGPPGPHEPSGSGFGGAGAAGDILWVLVGLDSGPRTLWIGTFEE